MTYSKAKVKSIGDKAVLIIDHSEKKYIRQIISYPKLTIRSKNMCLLTQLI